MTQPAPRDLLSIAADIEWHQAVHSTDPDIAALHWSRHADLVRQRASLREPGHGDLAGPDPAPQPSGGLGVG
jgi:hypothetical protein